MFCGVNETNRSLKNLKPPQMDQPTTTIKLLKKIEIWRHNV